MSLTVRATLHQTPAPDRHEVLDDHVVLVGDDGRIVDVVPAADHEGAVDVVLGDDEVLLPGLIDTHLHAPQWPQRGTGLDLPLERWLFEYTFPLEARFADVAYAEQVWDDLVPGLLSRGTTTAVYHASVHEEATVALAEACVRHGQRALVGRVAMDHPEGTPEWYRDADAGTAVAASARSIEAIAALPGAGDRVGPIITPRFVPACTDALLEGMGELAAATGVPVQTHCSESDWEHGYVLDRHGCTDTESLRRFGLLRDHTVLAHATHLTDDDRAAIAAHRAGVAHCPLSNAYFANAVFPARRALAAGVAVGLGTDIAGGPDASMLGQCGHAVTASRHLQDGVDVEAAAAGRGVDGSRIDVVTAFWMATAGGAELLGLPIGLLAPGRAFDAIAVRAGGHAVGAVPELDDPARRFEKIVRAGGSAPVTRVWVEGRDVTPSG